MQRIKTKGVLKTTAGGYPLIEVEPLEKAKWQDHDIFIFLAVVSRRITKISVHGDFIILHHDPFKEVEVLDEEAEKENTPVSSTPLNTADQPNQP